MEHEGRPFSSTENLEATMRKGAWFNLFCLDICMAGKSGMEFAWELRSWDERAGVFLSPPQQRIFEGGLSGHPIQYLFKPVRREELAEAPEADLRQRQVPRTLTARGAAVLCGMELMAEWPV